VKYATATAFRQALEQRIQREYQEQGLSHVRLRKLIVFDRFLARLMAVAPEGWVLKGGVALNLRWERHARSTKDLDLGRQGTKEEGADHLIAAASLDLGDFFTFSGERTRKVETMQAGAAARYRMIAELAGRRFDDITVDVGFSDPLVLEPDLVPGVALLEFAGIERLIVPTVALEQHIAEKLHAYTRTYGGGGSTRVKDLVDLVLAGQYDTPHAGRLQLALRGIFKGRGARPIPHHLLTPPDDWAVAYRKLAQEVGLPLGGGASVMRPGYEQVVCFLQPILAGSVPERAK
jgi:hypothetical protein